MPSYMLMLFQEIFVISSQIKSSCLLSFSSNIIAQAGTKGLSFVHCLCGGKL